MLTNDTYDKLKWVATQLIPALNVLVLAVGKIWDLPYYVQIAGTISAIGVFIGAIIYRSSKAYYSAGMVEDTFDDPDEYFTDEEEGE